MNGFLPKGLKIEINEGFKRALDIMENSFRNVFITGKAGTGKSTLLTYFRAVTKKRIVVLAPTGVGAVNVGGQTIHSFFHFTPDITPDAVKKAYKDDNPRNIYKKIDAIVIDEVSMVRADLLDCVDRFLKLNGPSMVEPFGGIQMILIGDLYQLPPVVTSSERKIFSSYYSSPYFFGAHVFKNFDMEFVELEKIYRQTDDRFIDVLNSIRNNSVTQSQINLLNKRYDPDFIPSDDEFFIYLTTTNKMADEVNEREILRIKGKSHTFSGIMKGEFSREYLPTAKEINLKKGAQIMLVNNDYMGRWINGTLGEIKSVHDEDYENAFLKVKLMDGTLVDVTRHTWEIFNFKVENDRLVPEVVGSFCQFPVRLAWAVTIHKSQGKTFTRAIIDMGRGAFAHGQTYVALSRCTGIDGIVLTKPIKKQHVLLDRRIVKFLTDYQYKKSDEKCSLDEKVKILKKAIRGKQEVEIIYLKASDEKSKRKIKPLSVGDMEYKGKTYLGLKALCSLRKEERHFRVDRILEILTRL